MLASSATKYYGILINILREIEEGGMKTVVAALEQCAVLIPLRRPRALLRTQTQPSGSIYPQALSNGT